jgi:hypothetical protein
MKCWNSAFNAQGSRVIIVVVQVTAVKVLKEKGMKLSIPPKLVVKLVWGPAILFCKISFPVKHLMPYYTETERSRPLIAWLYG